MTEIKIKRAYEKVALTDGKRILVDRLWPRGVSKEKIEIINWAKEIAPSAEIRKEFNHQPEKFQWFCKAYRKELKQNEQFPNFLEQIYKWLEQDNVTLLYGAKDEGHNHAVVLQEYLLEKLSEGVNE